MPFNFLLAHSVETLKVYAEYIKKTADPESVEAAECYNVMIICCEYLGSQIIIILADALRLSTSVRHLLFSWDSIDNDGLKALAQILRENCSIQTVELSHNRIGSESRKALFDMQESLHEFVEALKINTTLKELDLDDNYIGISRMQIDIFATALADFNLTKLNLARNGINDDGITMIAQALTANHCLRSLDLRLNIFKNKGLTVLADAIDKNQHLIEVFVDSYRECMDTFDPEILKKIDLALARNKLLSIAAQTSSEQPHVSEEDTHTPPAEDQEFSSSGRSSLQGSGHKAERSPDKSSTLDESYTEECPPDRKEQPEADEADEEVAKLMTATKVLFFNSLPPPAKTEEDDTHEHRSPTPSQH